MKKVLVELERSTPDVDRAVAIMFGRETPEQLLFADVESTYLKYLQHYGTQDIVVVTDKVEEQLYKVGAEKIQIVKPTPLTRLLNHKVITKIEVDDKTDMSCITYNYSNKLIQNIKVHSRYAEAAGIKEKTKRLHRKSQKKINKENKILLIKQLLPIILPIPLIIHSYNTENIIGLGVMTGITLAFLLQLIYDRKTTYTYERRI